MSTKKIVVCGATGSQGGAVVNSLLKRGDYELIAFSRQPSGQKAQALRHRGVKVYQGDLLDGGFLRQLFAGVDGVFGVTQPWSLDYKHCEIAAELRQGQNIVDACQINQVPHLILTSAINLTGQPTGIPHCDSKLKLEHYCQQSNVPFTILQLASFLDNIGGVFFPINPLAIRGFVARDAKVPYVACHDIGQVAATIFEQPDVYQNRVVRLIADLVSGNDLAHCLAQLTGDRRLYWAPPRWLMWLFTREFALMRKGMEEYGRPPKVKLLEEIVASCRAEFPHLWYLKDYLYTQGWGIDSQ